MKKWVLCSLLLAVISLACSRAPNLKQLIQEMTEVHNRHDVEKELSYWTADGVLALEGEKPAVGKAVLRNVFSCDSALNSEIHFQGFTVRGDTAIVNSLVERNDFFRLAGLPEVHYVPGTRITFSKGLIERIEIPYIVPEDWRILDEWSSGLMQWLRAVHPELADAFSQSTDLTNHNAEAAHLWTKLATEYNSSKSSRPK